MKITLGDQRVLLAGSSLTCCGFLCVGAWAKLWHGGFLAGGPTVVL